MSRHRFDGAGRFDQRYELDGIFDGTQFELQQYEGQTIPWYVFDRESSRTDPVYDVGTDDAVGGRRWKKPILLPVLTVIRTEGGYANTVEGSYVTDTVHVGVSVRQAERAGLQDLEDRPDSHLPDRFVWNGTVFSPTRIQERGLLQNRFTVIGIDALEVNPEELVNDPDFMQYAQPPDNPVSQPPPPQPVQQGYPDVALFPSESNYPQGLAALAGTHPGAATYPASNSYPMG